jgi:hypothetical protein
LIERPVSASDADQLTAFLHTAMKRLLRSPDQRGLAFKSARVQIEAAAAVVRAPSAKFKLQ